MWIFSLIRYALEFALSIISAATKLIFNGIREKDGRLIYIIFLAVWIVLIPAMPLILIILAIGSAIWIVKMANRITPKE